jgi:hypothetical protein
MFSAVLYCLLGITFLCKNPLVRTLSANVRNSELYKQISLIYSCENNSFGYAGRDTKSEGM